MTEDYHPPKKSDLLDVIHAEREQLETLIEPLTDEQMTAASVAASWSVKDILAHIAAWERLACDRIQAALSGEPLKFPLIKGDSDVDRFNAEVYAQNQDQTLGQVLKEYHDSHQDFLDLIETLQDDFLASPLPFDWAGNLTAQVMISANTHWHYIEHAESISKWLESKA